MSLPELSPEDRAQLVELEEAMWREATRFDLSFQQQRFASDFFEFGRSGRVYTREQAIRTDSSPILATLPLANLAIRSLGGAIAQVTYDSEVAYSTGVEHAHRSSIWSRSPAGWVMRFHQGTPFRP